MLALGGEGLEHGALGLLGLEEQRVVGVASQQQDGPCTRPHAADAHDLAGEVGVAVALDQPAAVAGQARTVGPQQRAHALLELLGFPVVEQLLDRHDQRRVRNDPRVAVHP